ncbi:MAG: hypothetical protein LBE79_13760 [Tannerella sp.]|jgi:hypothetical protein|nr:hypothetical protein [Tannerella sp.]
MKKIFLLCMAVTLTGIVNVTLAQERPEISDRALSAQYKYEINVLNSEIKTVKIKLRADQKNPVLRADLEDKQVKLNDVKTKKKIIDNAIKSKAASEKAARKAEKAEQNALRRADEAQRLREKERL